MEDIGNRIRIDRLANKLTLNELAKRVGIGVMTLQRIETGKSIPNVHVLIKISQQLNKSINDFLVKKDKAISFRKKKNIKKIMSGGLNVSALSPPEMEKRGVSVSYLIEKAGTILGPVKNEGRLIFICQLKGKVAFDYMGKKYKMKSGDCLYFDGNYQHTVTIEKDTESILVSIEK